MRRNSVITVVVTTVMGMSVLVGCGSAGTAENTTAATTIAIESAEKTEEKNKAAVTSNPGGEDGVFTIAYAPNESTDQSTDARNGLAKDLEALLGCPVEEIQASDYNAIIEALRTGKADMAYMGALALALGIERAGIEPIVMKAEDGDPEKAVYRSVLIAQAENGEINGIADLKGKTIAFVDPDSTSGNLVPTSEVIKAFPEEKLNSEKVHTNGDFFEAVSFSGSHQAGLQAVIKGDVDVVPISDQILASEIAKGNAAETDVKVIHESAPIPAEAMVVSAEMDDETQKKVQDFLAAYDNQAYFTDVIKKDNARFIPCSVSDYEPIIELNKVINEE
ncbi:MAG: phosphate/phosphite/phosphonate ABC transporter substrate-binding protein [Lachnospiraceae bacterium]